ncbi:MAG: DUF3179 domain-containing protein [Acidobacteria bacterium]|nr:DUF3179 domain-containing protein [Acidobacteriota bacterium]
MALVTATLWYAAQGATPSLERFVAASSADERIARAALVEIAAGWKDSYTPMFVDMARLLRPPRLSARETVEQPLNLDDDRGVSSPERSFDNAPDLAVRGSPIRRRLLAFLGKQTGRGFGDDLGSWREWMWKLPYDPHPDYAAFKGLIYGQIDPRMRAFFPPGVRASIRLDEIDWGGVPVNGIPPLRDPKVVSAAAAQYLKDSNVVFGLVVNDEPRAYPKRILAWHEMATDRVGGVGLTIVYCTLCGTVIPFESQARGRSFRFGTSGLLYRSNKLMFDEETHSLWSTFEGVPVVGPLTGSGVTLQAHAVVTTTWKEWRTEHPNTTVLSLDTGYARDYAEGAAYRDYFATDRLMFQVCLDQVSEDDAHLPGLYGSGRPRRCGRGSRHLRTAPAAGPRGPHDASARRRRQRGGIAAE